MQEERASTTMLQIDNPRKRWAATIVNYVGRIIYRLGASMGLWDSHQCDLTTINPPNILVIEIEPLGDVVMSTPVYSALRRRYPSAHIVALVSPWAKDILANNPYIDELILHNCPWVFSDPISIKKILEYAKYFWRCINFIKDLRVKKFGLAIDLRGDFRNILLFAFFAGAKYRLSYNRSGGEYLLSKAVFFERDKHEIDKNLNLISHLGISTRDRELKFWPSKNDEKYVETVLEEEGVSNIDFIIIHPGARLKVRWWPTERFGQVADAIVDSYKARIIITGTKAERSLAVKIGDLMKSKPIILSGKTTLLQLAVLLKKSQLLICPETSVMHIASATKTPTVVLYGPEHPRRTHPYTLNTIVLKKEFPCSPCLQLGCRLSKSGWSACMEAITVREVMDAVDNLLKKDKAHV